MLKFDATFHGEQSRTMALMSLVSLLLLSCSSSPSERIARGIEFDLGIGKLFVPEYFDPHGSEFDLIVHFHGAAWLAQENLCRSQKNAVLVSVHLGALSSSYRLYFQDQEAFQKILDTALQLLDEHRVVSNPKIHFLCITSFSAGYGGVRELLKVARYYGMIDAILLADGLHCNYADSVARTLDENQMAGFLRFARDAAEGRKIMMVTHSQIVPGSYASTTETADYLISGVGSSRITVSNTNERGMHYTSRCDVKQFHVHGFSGETGNDHMDHLYGMYLFLREMPSGE